MQKVISMILCTGLLVGCTEKVDKATFDHEISNMKKELMLVEKERDTYKHEYEELKNKPEEKPKLDGMSEQLLLQKGFVGTVEDIKEELFRNPTLIPYNMRAGDELSFVYDDMKVLTHEWVFAPIDNGHTGGFVLYSYTIENGLITSWRVVDSYIYGEEDYQIDQLFEENKQYMDMYITLIEHSVPVNGAEKFIFYLQGVKDQNYSVVLQHLFSPEDINGLYAFYESIRLDTLQIVEIIPSKAEPDYLIKVEGEGTEGTRQWTIVLSNQGSVWDWKVFENLEDR
ncbi:hypothetical protein LCL95_00605 [Bacillus timonensis]|nr:hypothetical protein [Bacillus timonensis]